MVKTIILFAFALFVTLFTMWKVEASPAIPELNKLIRPPQIIKYQQKPHAVFDYGGLKYLFVVSKTLTAFPTCNAVQTIGEELMVVRSDPFGHVFFVIKTPIAFQTHHSSLWEELVKESCEGCE
jgi:hypothetical protein